MIIKYENNKINQISYLKGFSIFTIVLFHLFNNYMNALPTGLIKISAIGGTGVHIFFFCSGLGLYLSYLRKPITYIEFIERRFLTIYIPYIVIVIVSFLIPWLYTDNDKMQALLSHVLLFKMFVPRYEESFGAQLWFISTIFQIYFLFIPMCEIKKRIKNKYLFGGMFIGIIIFWWIIVMMLGKSEVRVWNSFCLQYIWEIALGMLMADFFYEGDSIKLNRMGLIVAAILGIGLQAVMAMSSPVLKLFNDIPAFVGYISLALLLLEIPFVRLIAEKISKFSYELYLVHMGVFSVMFILLKAVEMKTQIITGCLALVVSCILAYLFHILVEKVIIKQR